MNFVLRVLYKLGIVEKPTREKLAINCGVKMGSNVVVMDGVNFGSEPYLIEIGNDVRIAEKVQFFTHDGGMWVLRNLHFADDGDLFGKIKIGNNVHIGAGAIICPNVKVGNNVIIGAGSIVTRNVTDNTVVAGVPARAIESIEEYYIKHRDQIVYSKSMEPEEKKKFLLELFLDKLQ